MKLISRRSFLIHGGTLITLFPLHKTFGSFWGDDLAETDDGRYSPTHHYIDESGADLIFYFINVKKHRANIKRDKIGEPSYLIVQLPPQSLHEQYYYDDRSRSHEESEANFRAFRADAKLSGPSYLVFELWPGQQHERSSLDIGEYLLNWEDRELFRLITADDLIQKTKEQNKSIKDNPPHSAPLPQLPSHKCVKAVRENAFAGRKKMLGKSGIYDHEYYKRILHKIFNIDTLKQQICLSFFELPAGLLLTPYFDNYRSDKQQWEPVLINNIPLKHKRIGKISTYTFSRNKLLVTRTVRERFNTELFYQPLPKPDQQPPRTSSSIHSVLPPALRAIAAIYEEDENSSLPKLDSCNTDGKTYYCDADSTSFAQTGYIPSLLDEQELIYLNQMADTPFKLSMFDITVPTTNNADTSLKIDTATERLETPISTRDGDNAPTPSAFLFTSLGASLKFHYQNFETKRIPDTSVSLVEYEHHFQDGRDNYIKVARIGLLCPTNEKALHVRIAQRKVRGRRSYMDYKEYVEIIEPAKEYNFDLDESKNIDPVDPVTGLKIGSYKILECNSSKVIKPDAKEGNTYPYKNYTRKIGWKKAETAIKRTPPIFPQGSKQYFWLVNETPVEFVEKPVVPGEMREPKDVVANLMKVPVNFYDCNSKPIANPSEINLLFLRRDFFCSSGVGTMLAGADALQLNWHDGRMRIPFHQLPFAILPDDSNLSSYADKDGALETPFIKNKINELPVEWIEYYFNIGDIGSENNKNVFDYFKHPIYPQMHRCKTVIENAQYTPGKQYPSVIEHHDQYLLHGLRRWDEGKWVLQELNAAKLVLKHTQDFIAGKLQDLKQGYDGLASKEAELEQGYKKLQSAFGEVSGKIGAFINPGPELINLSLTKAAISLPSGVPPKLLNNCFGGNATLDPEHLFNTLNAELLGGIPLRAIIPPLFIGDAPQYELNKLKGEIGDDLPRSITDNKYVNQALDHVKTLDKQITDNKVDLLKLQDELLKKQAAYEQQLTQLQNLVPDLGRIRSAAQLKFEEGKLQIFNDVQSDTNNLQRQILHRIEFVKAFIEKVPTDWYYNKSIANPFSQLKNNIDQLAAKIAPLAEGLQGVSQQLNNEILYVRQLLKGSGFREVIDQATASYDAILNSVDSKKQDADQAIQTIINGLLNGFIGDTVYAEFEKDLERVQKVTRYIAADIQSELATRTVQLDVLSRSARSWYTRYATMIQQDVNDLITTSATLWRGVEFNELKNCYYKASAQSHAIFKKYTVSGATHINEITEELKEQIRCDIGSFREALQLKISDIDRLINKKWNDIDSRAVAKLNELKTEVELLTKQVTSTKKDLEKKITERGKSFIDQLENKFNASIHDVKDNEDLRLARKAFEDLKNILNTVKQQELKYAWETTKLRSAELGIIRFTTIPGRTKLKAEARAITHMDPSKFPAVIKSTETTAYNELSNFSLTFLNAITIVFDKITYRAGNGERPDISVSIREVRFDGALAFIQKLQELLSSLAEGFIVELGSSHLSIGYRSPILSIGAPGFAFINFSFAAKLNIYFLDRRPMDITFALASRESKATIAAGIYGGGFFFSATGESRRGITAIEMAFEIGAYLGISLGLIHGELRFMVGLYYRKDDQGVVLEGYFIAEGILKFWIISVSVRLYMSVRSQNSRVTGICIMSCTVKIGFIKKTIEERFEKTLKGAESNGGGFEAVNGLAPRQLETINNYSLIDTFPFKQLSDQEKDIHIRPYFANAFSVIDETDFVELYDQYFS